MKKEAANTGSNGILERTFREERGRILATLIRLSGSFDLAEEALGEAWAAAIATWPLQGVPDAPGAWVTSVARRKLVDSLRRETVRREKSAELAMEHLVRASSNAESDPDMDYPDDRLRLIFTCCHPALNREAQVALTLRTLGGLTTGEIAKAFLLPEPTLAQRLVRAKKKIREAHIPYEVPGPEVLGERLDSVRAVLYLIFNEGYSATTGSALIRCDLCDEAIRLDRILCSLLPNESESLGLLALMMLQHARRRARTSEHGELVTLEEQDRSLWNQAEIAAALDILASANPIAAPGPFHIQAKIAAVHAQAKMSGETDWKRIATLYCELMTIAPSPVIKLNQAVAVALGYGLALGIHMLDEIEQSGELAQYYLLHAAKADLFRRVGRVGEARMSYERALDLITNEVERSYLLRRLDQLPSLSAAN